MQAVQQAVPQVGLAHESRESRDRQKSTAELDTEFLVMRLRDADRKAAADYVIQMYQAGGQPRIQKALAALKLWGYDPKRFQRWVSLGVPGLVLDNTGGQPVQQLVADLKSVDHPSARPQSPASSVPTESQVSDVTALATKSAKSTKSAVKLLGVQDFRIAVTDLATAQLNPGPQ